MKIMKTISKILMVLAGAMLIGQVNSYAAGDDDPVHLKKSLTKKDAGIYTITLETYVSGTSTVTTTEVTEPVDLCLVLDVSGSMKDPIGEETILQKVPAGTTLDRNKSYIYYRSGTKYYLEWPNNRWRYHTTSPIGSNDGTSLTSKNQDYTVNSSDNIYTYAPAKSKMQALQEAVCDFVDAVAAKAQTEGVDHRISIIKFADDTYYYSGKNVDVSNPSTGSTEGEAYIGEGNHRYNGGYNLTEVVKQFTAVNNSTGAESLKSSVNALVQGGATSADYGMKKATYLFADFVKNNPTRESNKVVVMFTDGEPNHSSGFISTVANAAITASNTLKSTYDAKVYTIGIFDSEDSDIRNYMNKVSSNYDSNGVAVPEADRQDNDGNVINYYQKSDGSDLSAIFTSIANANVSDNSTKKLDSESSAVIDIVSTNFSIPQGAENLSVSYKSYTGSDPEDPACWSDDVSGYSITTTTPQIDHATSTLIVPGFNFGKADEWNENTGALISKGNWVGPRKVNGVNSYWGLKMIVSFDVELDPEYEGGFDVPSNTAQSGLYLKDENTGEYSINVGYYGVPTEDFPAICIIKKGLDENESAIFTATQQDGRLYRVPLIQKINNGAKLPCYAIVKGLDGNKTVSVEEQSWSWLYTKEDTKTQKLISLQAANASKEDILKTGDNVSFSTGVGNTNVVIARKKTYTAADGTVVTFAVLARESRDGVWTPLPDKGDTEGIRQYSGAVVLLFEFTNTKNTSGKPARSEAYVHNVFKGGTNQSNEGAEAGGNEEEGLESGGNEEEGI